ncbi:putative endosomal cargo receptor [Blyttiomyces helicus]|uniref:Putative endosomal cargo receptor n=1 Tax=Blyttiomyces helicus TaxID=388810 RepID=A0A4P9W683_9FUNG|nr:putative endosomal cargo receptor [Blyttiomyces helicus]|eukprot:RKO87814.1 putative endosomal cargo receptor [Blyttiomyces helicus]
MLRSAALLLAIASLASATTLTYRMQPHEKACFYTTANSQGEKMAFYFAVQSGGSFDIDYDITGPKSEPILSGTKERQGDFVFSAPSPGEHTFCFSNVMSTFAEKLVDFDITAEHETNAANESPLPPPSTDTKQAAKKQIAPIEEKLSKLTASLGNMQRQQRYFRTRENRNFATVVSTEGRIFWFAVAQSGVIVFMALLQVFMIQAFFNKSVKTRV